MCHVYFMSTAMDSWSGFRVHNVIFRHVSVPSTRSVCVQKQCSDSSVCLRLFLSVCVRREENLPKQKSNQTRDTDRKKTWRRGSERERMNEEKAYYQKTDGPPIHSGPTGTWRDNSLHLRVTSAAERGGALKHDSVCVHFCLLTCKQKANL